MSLITSASIIFNKILRGVVYNLPKIPLFMATLLVNDSSQSSGRRQVKSYIQLFFKHYKKLEYFHFAGDLSFVHPTKVRYFT